MRDNKKNKTQLRRALNSITVNMLVYSLIASSSSAFAQQQRTEGHWVDGVLGLSKMVVSEMSNYQQTVAAAQAQTTLMATYRPQAIPSKEFPQCQIGQARAAFPQNMCNRPLQDPNEHAQAAGMVQVAARMSEFYENLLIGGQNTPLTVGIQCLETQQKEIQTSINDRINNLQKISDNIVLAQKQFEIQNDKLMKDMKDASRELNGGDSKDINAKVDFSAFFPSNQCQNIIGKQNIQSAGVNGGLNGILKVATEKIGTATDYNDNNRKAHVDDVNNQIAKMQQVIADDGIDAWAKGPGGMPNAGVSGSTAFKAYQSIVSEKVYSLTAQRQKVEKELKDLDPSYRLPEMDEQFVANFSSFSNGAEAFFKKKYINDCVTKAENGVALSNSQVLRSLNDGRGNKSSAFKKYSRAISDLLDNDNLFLEDKMQKIKELQAQYGKKMKIAYTDSDGLNQNKSTYDYLNTVIDRCGEKFSSDNSNKPGGHNNVAQKIQIDRAKSYMEELEADARNFAADLSAEIKNKVIHCDGIAKKANQCAEGPFDASSDNFCIAHADSCVSEIQNCFNVANQEVEKRKTTLNAAAKVYNQRSNALIKQQQIQLAQLSSQVQNDAEFLKKYFPGADYKYPEGLLIPPLKPTMSEFGVELIGGGTLDYLATLPNQIMKLKAQLAEQAKTVNSSIESSIAAQKKNMQENKDKWTALSQSCDDKQFSYRQQIAKQNAEAQQIFGKARNEALQVCSNYSQLSQSSAAPGCKDGDHSIETVYGDAVKASAFLNPQVIANMNAYRNVCANSNAEVPAGSEDDDQLPALQKACQSDSWGYIASKLKKDALSSIPKELEEHTAKIENYLDNKGSLPDEVLTSKFGRSFQNTYKALYPKAEKEENLAEKYKDVIANAGEVKGSDEEDKRIETNKRKKALRDLTDNINEKANTNVCEIHKNNIIKSAIDECEGEKSVSAITKCFKKEKKEGKKSLNDDNSNELTLAANSALESLSKGSESEQWSRIGERTKLGDCMAQAANTRLDPNASAVTSSIENLFREDAVKK